jgi:CRP/FNR family transcriptional regulator, cyclic AMP receptor protein
MDSALQETVTTLPEALFAGATRKTLKPGQILFRSGDRGDGCYRLEKGVVKVVMSSAHDHERIIAILGPGSVIGELSMLDSLPRSASIIAIQDCELLFITRDAFRKYVKEHPTIFEQLTAMLARRLRETDELLAASSFLNIKARLARAFLELSKHLGQPKDHGQIEIAHRISQSDLAAMAGIARENVSRTLAEWRQQNILSQDSQRYCLSNVRALEQELQADS